MLAYKVSNLLKQASFNTKYVIRILSSSQVNDVIRYNNDIIIRNVDKTQQSPLVVIVGWSNSKLRQLEKYSQIYEDLGCTVLSSRMPLYRFSMFYDTLFSKDTQNVIDAMTSQRELNKNRKVFFKLFSTPGPAMYVNIMNYYFPYITQHFGTVPAYRMGSDETKPNIIGVIFDSATVESGNAQQFANGMKGNSTGILANTMFDVLGKIVYAYAVRTSKMHNYGPEFIRNIPVLLPQLFLSSKADNIASIESIRNFVSHQKSLGIPLLKSKVWEDSAHVLHFRKYPNEYKDLIECFIDECVELSKNVREFEVVEEKDAFIDEKQSSMYKES